LTSCRFTGRNNKNLPVDVLLAVANLGLAIFSSDEKYFSKNSKCNTACCFWSL